MHIRNFNLFHCYKKQLRSWAYKTHKSNLEDYNFGEEMGRRAQDVSQHREAHACVECKARSSSVLEVERLSAENGSLQASILNCKMIQT
jgi:hypothetical protein